MHEMIKNVVLWFARGGFLASVIIGTLSFILTIPFLEIFSVGWFIANIILIFGFWLVLMPYLLNVIDEVDK